MLFLCANSFVGGTTDAAPTNTWQAITGVGKWEFNVNWNQGVPSLNHGVHFVRPAGGFDALATVDAATVASNAINGCLTVSNLTVAGTSGPLGNFATLALNNANNGVGFSTLTILSNLSINARGSLTITNSRLQVGTVALGSGEGLFNNGFVLINAGGELITTNGFAFIGKAGTGQMTVQGGAFQARFIGVGDTDGQGTLTIAGGSTRVFSLVVCSGVPSTGTVWLTGGELVTTNLFTNSGTILGAVSIGLNGSGRMTVSNGMWHAAAVGVDRGTLTIAGGTITHWSELVIGALSSDTGTVWMTGGQLISTNSLVYIGLGLGRVGQMTVSNGTWVTGDTLVGANGSSTFPSKGALTLAGGATTISGVLALGHNSNAVGAVQVTGGQVIATNFPVLVGNGVDAAGTLTVAGSGNPVFRTLNIGAGTESLGTLAMNGGQLRSSIVNVGFGHNSRGTLSAAGGTTTVTSNIVVGNCLSNAFGLVRVQGGSLYVTNTTHDAVLDVRYGWILLNVGLLAVDKLVITNDCGHFFRNGGTLSIGSLVLDPDFDADLDGLPNGWEQTYGLDPLSSTGDDGTGGDPDGDGYDNYEEYVAGSDPRNPLSTPVQIIAPPFQFTSIVRSGNNIILTWITPGGTTNQLQVTSGAGGSYATNGFTNLGSQMIIPGSGNVTTNYTDTGGATNNPARYYRIRLVP